MLIALGRLARRWAASINPWTNVYGLARTLLAVGTGITLAFNHSTILFRATPGVASVPFCHGPAQVGIFCIFSTGQLDIARWLAVAILVVVASGWRPRLTGLPHWWISFSLQASSVALDGGDHVTAVLTLLMLPVALTDGRRWHWQGAPAVPPRGRDELKRILALSSLIAIRIQVAGIYLHTSLAKFRVEEWADGTALYYWWTDPTIGVADWLRPFLMPMLTHSSVALLTWGAILLELTLFMGLVMPRAYRSVLLVAGIAFHVAIAIMMGLISFSMAMFAALVLYLRPVEKEFALAVLRKPLLEWLRWSGLRRLPLGRVDASI